MSTIYTIGYTAFNINQFIEILNKYNISCLIDVRSIPIASEQYSEYSRTSLEPLLKQKNIIYRNYAEEFGARQSDQSFFAKDGYLDFNTFSKSDSFIRGANKIKAGIEKGFVFVLMCAEKDPINCHRNIMVASALYKSGYNIENIMADGNLQGQNTIEKRLLEMYFPNRDQISLFNENVAEEELISQAYIKRNKDIGYVLEAM